MKKIGFLIAVAVAAFSTSILIRPQDTPVQADQTAKATATQPDKEAQVALGVLLGAIEANNYTAFLAPLDDQMKQAITGPLFDTVVAQYASRLKQGYDPVYFGEMRKLGYKVHLWKLTFKDDGDDVLAELSMKDGKVGGFFLR